MIKTYPEANHQDTLKLRKLFKTTREVDTDRFENFQTFDNHRLLGTIHIYN